MQYLEGKFNLWPLSQLASLMTCGPSPAPHFQKIILQFFRKSLFKALYKGPNIYNIILDWKWSPLGTFPTILPFWYHYPALILEEEQKAHEFNFILKRLIVHRGHFMMCMVLNDTKKLWRFDFCFRFTDLFYPVPAALLVVLVRKIAERWDMQTKRDFQN